ncbi:MAG: hemolysin family protein [Myxococcota bacterium]|nr:hemolysin family protein [Myxococcota bacterium]MDW8361998.1 hemolysin family protein [Myxococcales bacterium]
MSSEPGPLPWLALLGALGCVAANAFFVLAEFALAKARPSALEARARAGDRAAARALSVSRALDAHLGAAQLGITLASLGLGWLGEPALAGLLQTPFGWLGIEPETAHAVALAFAFATISLLHVVVGELVPKSVAIRRAEPLARATAGLLHAFLIVSWPALALLNGLANRIVRLLGFDTPSDRETPLSTAELRLLVRASLSGDPALERKRALVERVLVAGDMPVRAVMVPRVDMVVARDDATVGDVLALVRQHGYSRYLLCADGNPDRVTGYVHVKDLLAADQPLTPAARFRRDLPLVHDTRTVGDVLDELRLSGGAMALVVDEYGGTAGLVTLEDLLEQFVGEIRDEGDTGEPEPIVRHADGSLLARGDVPVEALAIEGFERPVGLRGDTLGGLVTSVLGRIARPGDRTRLGAVEVEILEVRRGRIVRLRLVPRAGTDASQQPSSS